jgi:hypothetical protein
MARRARVVMVDVLTAPDTVVKKSLVTVDSKKAHMVDVLEVRVTAVNRNPLDMVARKSPATEATAASRRAQATVVKSPQATEATHTALAVATAVASLHPAMRAVTTVDVAMAAKSPLVTTGCLAVSVAMMSLASEALVASTAAAAIMMMMSTAAAGRREVATVAVTANRAAMAKKAMARVVTAVVAMVTGIRLRERWCIAPRLTLKLGVP